MRLNKRFYAIGIGVAIVLIALGISLTSPPATVKAQYVVGGSLEAPEITRGTDYGSILIVTGIAIASILIGLAVASKIRERAE